MTKESRKWYELPLAVLRKEEGIGDASARIATVAGVFGFDLRYYFTQCQVIADVHVK